MIVAPILLLKDEQRSCEVRIRFGGRRFPVTLAAGKGYLSNFLRIRGRN